jgi:parallel beta-helix repeat protein
MKTKSFFIGLFLSLILCLTIVNSGAADTTVSGIINNDTTWTLANSPYIVTGNLLVSEGITLTIEPGVEVRFETEKVLQIEGTLIARGINDNVITFTSKQSSPVPGDWGYIYFTDTSQSATFDEDENYTGGSILEYCIVVYAGGLDLDNNGAVRMDNAYPFINYCTIQNNSASGIYAWNLSDTLKVTNSIISNNTSSAWYAGGGIHVSGDGTVTISNNAISNNTALIQGGGMFVRGGTSIISNNTISNNTSVEGGGIYACSDGTVTISDNTISNNSSSVGGGIYAGGPDYLLAGTVTILHNTISNNTSSGGGGGIYIYSIDIATISDNTISNNTGSTSVGSFGGGGGILISAFCTIAISNNTICNNFGRSMGGGIHVSGDGTVSIVNNIISKNTVSPRSSPGCGLLNACGGGICIHGHDSGGDNNNTVNISNNIIIKNTTYSDSPDWDAGEGSGIYTYRGSDAIVNISNNIISENTISHTGGGICIGDAGSIPIVAIFNNSLIRNSASNYSAIHYCGHYEDDQNFNYNTITGNVATGTEPTYAVYVSSHPLFNYNNIFDNVTTYEFYNANSSESDNVNAENNWWGTKEESEIQAKIYDWFDDGTKGFVDYSPFLMSLDTTAPISPPSNSTF